MIQVLEMKSLQEFLEDAELILKAFQEILFQMCTILVDEFRFNSELSNVVGKLWNVLLRWWVAEGWGVGKPPLVRIMGKNLRSLYEVQENTKLAVEVDNGNEEEETLEDSIAQNASQFEDEMDALGIKRKVSASQRKKQDRRKNKKRAIEKKIANQKRIQKLIEREYHESSQNDHNSSSPGELNLKLLLALIVIGANHLGEVICLSDLKRWIHSGKLPVMNLGKLIRSDLLKQLELKHLNIIKIFEMSTKFSSFPQYLQYIWLKLREFVPALRNPEFVSNPQILGLRFTLQLGFTRKLASYVVKFIEFIIRKTRCEMSVPDVLAAVTAVVQIFYGLDNIVVDQENQESAIDDLLSLQEWKTIKPTENQICDRIFQELGVNGMSDQELELFLSNASRIISAKTGDFLPQDFETLSNEITRLFNSELKHHPLKIISPVQSDAQSSHEMPWKRVKIYSAQESSHLPLPFEMENFLGFVCSLAGTDLLVSRSRIISNAGKFIRIFMTHTNDDE
jgi:hypothetical protein